MITAGEVLKNKREFLKKSIDTVSQDTKIQRRFIEYIEKNNFSHFDSEIFLTGFIKIYAKYLGLDTDKVLALYRRSNPKREEKQIKKDEIKKKSLKDRISLDPRFLITVFLGIFLISIISYIAIQIYKFQSPPKLDISDPKQESIFDTEDIIVRGKTETNSTVEINGLPVEINEDGSFEKSVILKEGINIINIKARKNNNNTLESLETRKVTFTPKTEEEKEIEEKKEENILTITVEEAAAWIKLDIDSVNKLSQVVEPSKQEFTVVNTFYIISGRVSSTKILWNDTPLEWPLKQTSGVVEMTCTVTEDTLKCE